MKKFFNLVAIVIVLTTTEAYTGKQNKPQVLNPVVRTQSGLVKGIISETGSVTIFKGIPYAAPPVGDLRWKEPQPPIAWEGVRDASKYCASCMQNKNWRLPWTKEFMVQDNDFSEDCLFLNIWTSVKQLQINFQFLFSYMEVD